tara:strand:+ start:108 stop:335 length:228 start_codon:yes stop_codon:yes gene_type:complete
MTNKINIVINLSILGLLIYLAVAIKKIEDKVFPDPRFMIPLTQMNYEGDWSKEEDQIGWMIKNLLINKLKEANNG